MGTIQIQNLSFKYMDMSDYLFEKTNLKIDESWKLGLIGRNGRGKTTLLNILQQKLSYEGTIITDLNFNYFPQKISNSKKITKQLVLEIGSITDYNFWKLQIEMDKLQLDEAVLELPYEKLSPGQKTKLQLALMFVEENSFQLIDEPTNHLDIVGRQVVSDYLRDKKGFIVISHDKKFLNEIIDHVLSINRKNITVQKGNYDTWEYEKNIVDQKEKNEKEKLKSEIKQLKESAREKENWSNKKENSKSRNAVSEKHANLDKGFIGHKSAKLMKRSKTLMNRMNKNISHKSELMKNIEISDDLSMNLNDEFHQKNILEVKNFQSYFDKKIINEKVSFKVNKNEITALVGPNGAGKSTALKAILNEDISYLGSIKINGKPKISYLQQETIETSDNIVDLCEIKNISRNDVFSMLRKLGFERHLFNKKINTMSEGQKRKIALAISLVESADFYIWDEPLNYLDIITRQQIIEVLEKYHPTMIVIDHDQDFINEIATNKIEFQAFNCIEN